MKYKIDFNNGKVFEVEKEGSCFVFPNKVVFTRFELEEFGATITEIKEPIKFECDVEWRTYETIVFPYGDFLWENFVGKRGKLTFIESEE